MRQFYTIVATDIDKPTIRCFARVWRVDGFLGRVMPMDVGKRVYLVGDILQVENNEQMARRLKDTADLTRTVRPTNEHGIITDRVWWEGK